MKIVLDTNCLLVSVQEYSDFFWLWQQFRDKKFGLCYTGEILNEYQEVLSHYYSGVLAQNVIDAILNASHADRGYVFASPRKRQAGDNDADHKKEQGLECQAFPFFVYTGMPSR